MAKTSTYSDELLLDAVVKYSLAFPQKIVVTKLAEWASANIPGLEGVKAQHFTRPKITKNPKTKKTKEVVRDCKKKIDEINEARNPSTQASRNILLKSADINAFFSLSQSEQRALIIETRNTVDSLLKREAYLEKENQRLSAENADLKQNEADQEKRLNEINDSIRITVKKLDQLSKIFTEARLQEVLAGIGISDHDIDLVKNTASTKIQADEVYSINSAAETGPEPASDAVVASILEGLDF